MIAKVRIYAAIALFAAATPFLALAQMLALRGLFSPDIVPRLWHRLILKCLGLKVRAHGSLSDRRPLLVASNHISWADIMVLGATADVRFIAKAEVAGWPGMGTIARLNRTVFVERDRKRKAGEQAGEIAQRLIGGDALVLFPEGTTADGNFILPFKSTLFGAAKLALDEGAPTVHIQPVAISYTRLHALPLGRYRRLFLSWTGDAGLLPSLREILSQRALDVELHFGEPVAFTSASSRKQAAREVEDRVRDMFRAMLRHPQPM
ncbi:MAG: 1-acyl-sn-glycerol-3-phosphate acyltransferase [Rhizobiaceae bacterium]|nr:1-acyl-sn-glycerol-3-phosphate acyltransferase [Rhizobiaceae bacterium]